MTNKITVWVPCFEGEPFVSMMGDATSHIRGYLTLSGAELAGGKDFQQFELTPVTSEGK